MKILLKKVFIVLLAFLVLLASSSRFLVRPVQAQEWYDQNPFEFFTKVYDPSNSDEIFGERYTAAQVQWVLWGLLWAAWPFKPFIYCILTQDIGACISLTPLGSAGNPSYAAQPESSSLLASVFEDRPLSGVTYTKNLLRKFRLVPQVEAQAPGFGFQGLDAIQSLWKASRDIAYYFFIIAFIVTAFMIMFRVRLSPQTVITVQSALPKIVIALILVTFSYAIAGFLVDLMYVATGVISLLIASSGAFLSGNAVTVFNWMTKGTLNIPLLPSSLDPNLGIAGMFIIYLLLFTLTLFSIFIFGGGILGTIVVGITGLTGPMLLISLIISFILYVVLIFIAFKIAWMLLKAFATILLLTIVAPLQIATGVFVPSVGFGTWVRSFLANLAVFPLTGLFITLAYIFLIYSFRIAYRGFIPGWLDVFHVGVDVTLTPGWPPLLGVSDRWLAFIFLGTSLAVLFLAPKVADIIKGLITGRPFAYGTAIGEAIAPIGLMYGATLGPTVGAAREAYSKEGASRMLDWTGKKLEKYGPTTFIGRRMRNAAGRQ